MRHGAALALAAALGPAVPVAADPPPAAGGAALVRAAEAGGLVVVGTVRGTRAVDLHGWTATIDVERSVVGPAAPGDSIGVAWEERARSRPPRLPDGGRALVALSALPETTLWLARFPAPPRPLVVSSGGEAFLRDPDAATADLLEGWAKLGASEREGSAGVGALAALWAGAHPSVAEGALARLAEIPGLADKLHADAAARLAAGLSIDTRPIVLRRAALQLAGDRRLGALREAIESLTRPGHPLEAPALDALAHLDAGLVPERVERLLTRPEAALRVVGVRWARGAQLGAAARLVKEDPSPEVRAAAVASLVDQQGFVAFEAASPALFDASADVRAAAAKRIGGLGATAVPALVALVESRGMPEAGAPLAALALAGPEGRAAAERVATEHPDARVRAAARLALGMGRTE